jgi:hypothetical protein
MLVERQLVLLALQVNIMMLLDKQLKLVAKLIVVLDRTLLPIKLRVLFVKKDNGKSKPANPAVKCVVLVNITMQ